MTWAPKGTLPDSERKVIAEVSIVYLGGGSGWSGCPDILRWRETDAVPSDNVEPISAEAQTPLRALKRIVQDLEEGRMDARAMVLIMTNDLKESREITLSSVGCTPLQTVGMLSVAKGHLIEALGIRFTD